MRMKPLMVVGIGLLNLKIESVVVAPSVGIVRRMMVIVVVMIGGKKEARLVIVHGLEMETRRRISR
jgi:hypothetical protein